MARFIFDCEDEICLPAAYRLVDEVKNFVEKMKTVEINAEEAKGGKNAIFKKIVENMLVHHPADTGRMFSKLWVLDEGEKAPNVFRTMNALFTNEVALDFFTCVLPSLLSLSRKV